MTGSTVLYSTNSASFICEGSWIWILGLWAQKMSHSFLFPRKVWMRCISSLVQILVILFFQNYVCMVLLEHKRWQHNAVLYSDQPLLTAFLDLDTSIIKNHRLGLVQVSFLKVDSEHFKLPGCTSEPKKLDFLVKLLKHYRKENGLQGVNRRLMTSSAQSIYFNPPWQLGLMRVGD